MLPIENDVDCNFNILAFNMASTNASLLCKEEERGLRLRLLMETATETLRKKFHQYFPTDPRQLHQKLLLHKNKLRLLTKRKVMFQDQFDILFPSNGLTDSKAFDITLLTLLLGRVCGLTSPQLGWSVEPWPQDQSNAAHIVLVRTGRNKLLHTGLKMSLENFTTFWDDIENSLVALVCTKKELDGLKICPLDLGTVQRLETAEKNLKATIINLHETEYNLHETEQSLQTTTKKLQTTADRAVHLEDSLLIWYLLQIATSNSFVNRARRGYSHSPR